MHDAQETVVKNNVLVQKCNAVTADGSFSYMQSHGKSENPDLTTRSLSPVPTHPHTFPKHFLSVNLCLPGAYTHWGVHPSDQFQAPLWVDSLNAHEWLENIMCTPRAHLARIPPVFLSGGVFCQVSQSIGSGEDYEIPV